MQPFTTLRRHWRFSLRSLLLASLLFACAGTVWSNWIPIVPIYAFDSDELFDECVFSSDERYFCTLQQTSTGGSWPNMIYHVKIHLKDARTGSTIRKYEIETRLSGHIRFSPASEHLYLASGNVYIQGWNIATGEPLPYQAFTMEPHVRADLNYSRDGKILAVCTTSGGKGKLQMFRFPNLTAIYEHPYDSSVGGLGFAPDGNWFAAEFDKDTIKLVSVETGNTEREINIAGRFPALDDELSPDGKFVAVPARTGDAFSVILYSTADGRRVVEYPGLKPKFTPGFYPDGSRYVTMNRTEDNITATVWKTGSMNAAFRFDDCEVEEISSSGDCLFAESDRRRDFKVFDAHTGQLIWKTNEGLIIKEDRAALYGNYEMLFDRDWAGVIDLKTGARQWTLRGPAPEWGQFGCGTGYEPKEILRYAISENMKYFAVDDQHYAHRQLDSRSANVYMKRRPLQWWGVAMQPEFWFGCVIVIALIWSFARDRRDFR